MRNGTNRLLTVHDRPLMLNKTVNNFERLSGSRPTLIQREPVQPLDRDFDVLLSPKFSHEFLLKFRLVNHRNNQIKLTKSPLLDLLGGKGERRNQFYDYLH